jgi:site-specific DNA recombinase
MFEQNQKNKYFLYARKSSESEDKQMTSIDSQINELEKLSKQNNLKIVKIFSESKSAKAPGRPVYDEMMAGIKKGEADGILCWKLNRLARNPVDGGEISWMIQQGIIKHIQTYGRSYYPSDNVIVMAVELGMANQWIRDLSVDTKRGLKTKAERGWYPTFTSLGYIHNPIKKKGDKEIIKDKKRFNLVRKMFDLFLEGMSVDKIVKESISWGFKSKQGTDIAKSTFYRILSDPFYYGEFEYPKDSGNWYQGKHKPMISKEEFDEIQIMLGKKTRPRPIKHVFPFTGIIRCGECGAMITAENKIKKQKNGNIHNYTYYHCTKRKRDTDCTQKTIRDEKLEKQIKEKLKNIEIPKDFAEWTLQTLREVNKDESRERNKIIASQQASYTKCVKKIDNLIDLRAGNEITEKEFSKKRNEALGEKKRLKELINSSDNRIDEWLNNFKKTLEFAENAREAFASTKDINVKREILSILGSNLLLKDGKLTITTKKPLSYIEEAVPEVISINKRLEPLKNGLNKQKLWVNYSQSPILLPGSDSNRRPID